ncbi:MAG: cell wall hydrolase [Halanaerobiaceae bacterium]
MNKNIIKYTSIILCLVLFIQIFPGYSIIPLSSKVEASSISENEVYKGLGVALILVILSRLGKAFDSSDSVRETVEDEVELLARVIHAEARGEPYEGKVGVGAVVVNRQESSDFPDNIEDIIYQSRQFSSVDDGQIDLNPDESAYEAAKEALSGEDPTEEAMYFYNPDTARHQDWFQENTEVTKKIGNHVFAVKKTATSNFLN